MSNNGTSYIQLISSMTQEEVIVGVDDINYDIVLETLTTAMLKYTDSTADCLHNYIEEVIDGLPCGIIIIDSTVEV